METTTDKIRKADAQIARMKADRERRDAASAAADREVGATRDQIEAALHAVSA